MMMDSDVETVAITIVDLVQYVQCVENSMKVLELFAGSRSVGRVAEELGHEVFSVDWENFEGIDLSIDIGELTIDHLPFIPDVVWASPDCTTYTIAACSTHRTNSIEPKSDYAIKCDSVNRSWIDLVQAMLVIKPEMVFFIENPRGMLRKMPFMQEFKRHTIWYCQYGDDRAKPTDIWTNSDTWIPRPECHNYRNGIKHCHHQAAPRGSKTGTQGRKNSYERSKIPRELCMEILLSAERKEDLVD